MVSEIDVSIGIALVLPMTARFESPCYSTESVVASICSKEQTIFIF